MARCESMLERNYRIDNKIYETKEDFLEAIKDFNPNIIPIKQ